MFDVAIVGYGPAGAVAAALLGQAGLSVQVCDRLRGVYEIPRAIALDHEIMRVFQELNLVDAIAPFTEPFTNSEFFGVDGQLIKCMSTVAEPYPLAYTPSLVFSQPPVEAALRAHVRSLPNVTVSLGDTVTAVTQDSQAATLTLVNAQGHSTFSVFGTGCLFVGGGHVIDQTDDQKNRDHERKEAQEQHLLGCLHRTGVVFVCLIVVVVAHSVL